MKTTKLSPIPAFFFTLLLFACRQPDNLPTLPPVTIPMMTIPTIEERSGVTGIPSPTLTPTLIPTETAPITVTTILIPTASSVSTQPVETPTICSVPFGWVVYIVQPGDTVGDLARRTGASMGQIQQANCLTNINLIYRGQPLYLPFIPTTLTPVPTSVSFMASLTPSPPPPDPQDPLVEVIPNSGTPGTAFNLTITNFPTMTNATLEILYRRTVIYSETAMTDREGHYLFVYQSPIDAPLGTYTVRVTSGDKAATGQFTIVQEQ